MPNAAHKRAAKGTQADARSNSNPVKAAKGPAPPAIHVVSSHSKSKKSPRRSQSARRLKSPRAKSPKRTKSPKRGDVSPRRHRSPLKRQLSQSSRSSQRSASTARSRSSKLRRSPKRSPRKLKTPRNPGTLLRRPAPTQQGESEFKLHQAPTNSEAHFEYYIDGKPANNPQIAKVLSNLFAHQFSTETKAPTTQDKAEFAPKFLPPTFQTHQGHPQQFTQIMIPEGQDATMEQPEDMRVPSRGVNGSVAGGGGGKGQAKAPYIVFNNNIENHGHLVLNQNRGAQGLNSHGEGPSDCDVDQLGPEDNLSSGEGQGKHVYTQEQTLEFRQNDEGEISVKLEEDIHEFQKDEQGNIHPVNDNSIENQDNFENIKQAQSQERVLQDYPQEVVDQWEEHDVSGEAHSRFVEDGSVLCRAGQAVQFDNTMIDEFEKTPVDHIEALSPQDEAETSGQFVEHSVEEGRQQGIEEQTFEVRVEQTTVGWVEDLNEYEGSDRSAQMTQEEDDRSRHQTPSLYDELEEIDAYEQYYQQQYPDQPNQFEGTYEGLHTFDQDGNIIETVPTTSNQPNLPSNQEGDPQEPANVQVHCEGQFQMQGQGKFEQMYREGEAHLNKQGQLVLHDQDIAQPPEEHQDQEWHVNDQGQLECSDPGQLQMIGQGQFPVDVNLIEDEQGDLQDQGGQNLEQDQGQDQGQGHDGQDWEVNDEGQFDSDVPSGQIHITGQGHFEVDINLNRNDQSPLQPIDGEDAHQNQEWQINHQGQLECADHNQVEIIGQGHFPVDINLIEVDPRVAQTQDSQEELREQANMNTIPEGHESVSDPNEHSGKKYVYKDEQVIEIRSQISQDFHITSDVTHTSSLLDETGATIEELTQTFMGGE